MIVEVTGPDEVRLLQTEDLRRLSVVMARRVGDADVDEALGHAGAGHVDGDHVRVSIGWLRVQVSDRPDPYLDRFAEMIAYADSRGWVDQGQQTVKAHVDREAVA